ncbi:MAG: hypothetical protein IJ097_04775 [Bacilli bacterium]|nr:hypothetical protein [Bacilli bacterium]
MKKLLLVLFTGIAVFGITKNTYALGDVYYTTPNGIELNREEYEFLVNFYGAGYLNIMTRDMYDEFVEEDLINSDVEIKTYDVPQLPLLNPGISPNSEVNHTTAKTLQIGKACLPTYCMMSLLNTWHGSPTIRSWDNIGTYLYNVNLISYTHAYVDSTAGTEYFNNWKTDPNGHGVGNSVKLPDNGNDIIINMGFKVSKGGTVFGSYQHAMQNTTLLNSKNYTLDLGGYGGVFLYNGNAVGVYDGMNGVDINV